MEENKIEILKYITIALRHKYWVLIPFIICLPIISAITLSIPDKYESSATLMLEAKADINPLGKTRSQTLGMENIRAINSLILSYSRLLKVVKKLDLDLHIKSQAELEELINKIRKNITNKNIGQNLFTVNYKDKDPKITMQIANTISNLFVEENLELTRGIAYTKFNFINEQLNRYREKLEESERKLKDFKVTNVGQMPNERNVNIDKLKDITSELVDIEGLIAEMEMQLELIKTQIVKEKPMIVLFEESENESSNEPIQAEIKKLEYQLSQLMNQYTDKYPAVIKVKKEIEYLKKQLNENKKNEMASNNAPKKMETTGINPYFQILKEDYNNAQIELNVLKLKKENLIKQEKEFKTRVDVIPEKELGLIRLTRDYNVNEKIYQMLLQQLEESRIAMEMEKFAEGRRFTIVDQARMPIKPSQPNTLILFIITFGISGGIGIAFVVLREFFDNSLHDIKEAETFFYVPILSTIPTILLQDDLKKRRQIFAIVLVFGIISIGISSIIIFRRYTSEYIPFLKQIITIIQA